MKALLLTTRVNLYSKRELGYVIKERIWGGGEAERPGVGAEFTGKSNRIENVSKNPSFPSVQCCNMEQHL
jgi:hypothetical protein